MSRMYDNEADIRRLVRDFQSAKISRDEWKHAEHLLVALCYLEVNDLESATAMMRRGIFNLLESGFRVDLRKEMPYHETLTVFWMRTVKAFAEQNSDMTLVEKGKLLVETFDKDHPLKFYSRERLFSDEARASLVEPDLVSTPAGDGN
jgi:hypothetical protein